MNNRDKSALALALAIVGGIAAGMRCDASEWVENSAQINLRPAAYTVKTYTEGSDPFIPRIWWKFLSKSTGGEVFANLRTIVVVCYKCKCDKNCKQ